MEESGEALGGVAGIATPETAVYVIVVFLRFDNCWVATAEGLLDATGFEPATIPAENRVLFQNKSYAAFGFSFSLCHSSTLSGVLGTVTLFSMEVALAQKTTQHYPIQSLAEQKDCAYGDHE